MTKRALIWIRASCALCLILFSITNLDSASSLDVATARSTATSSFSLLERLAVMRSHGELQFPAELLAKAMSFEASLRDPRLAREELSLARGIGLNVSQVDDQNAETFHGCYMIPVGDPLHANMPAYLDMCSTVTLTTSSMSTTTTYWLRDQNAKKVWQRQTGTHEVAFPIVLAGASTKSPSIVELAEDGWVNEQANGGPPHTLRFLGVKANTGKERWVHAFKAQRVETPATTSDYGSVDLAGSVETAHGTQVLLSSRDWTHSKVPLTYATALDSNTLTVKAIDGATGSGVVVVQPIDSGPDVADVWTTSSLDSGNGPDLVVTQQTEPFAEIYASRRQGKLTAYDFSSGRQLWSTPVAMTFGGFVESGSRRPRAGVIYSHTEPQSPSVGPIPPSVVPSSDWRREVTSLEPLSGQVRWTKFGDFGMEVSKSSTLVTTVNIGSDVPEPMVVESVESATGKQRWSRLVRSTMGANLVLSGLAGDLQQDGTDEFQTVSFRTDSPLRAPATTIVDGATGRILHDDSYEEYAGLALDGSGSDIIRFTGSTDAPTFNGLDGLTERHLWNIRPSGKLAYVFWQDKTGMVFPFPTLIVEYKGSSSRRIFEVVNARTGSVLRHWHL